MTELELAEKELADTLDKYNAGMADYMDIAIAMTAMCGLASPELGDRARAILMNHLEKKKVGKPKTAPTEKIKELRAAGMTQEKIAQELNISLSTVRRELRN